ncbi:hypothetical protein GCM10027085_02210 [Spirosoma aerophilum]
MHAERSVQRFNVNARLSILPTASFHTIANLRSEESEIIDTQMTAPAERFINIELSKFDKQLTEIATDLEKLVYTMKTLHTTEPT